MICSIDLLSKAKICHKIYHSHCSGLPLDADIKETVYKLLFMDIGIMNHICGNDWTFFQSFQDHDLVNEGAVAEQFIGQHLLSPQGAAPSLNYWVRQARTSNAEVDYVISHQISTATGIESARFSLLSLPLYLVESLPQAITDVRTRHSSCPA